MRNYLLLMTVFLALILGLAGCFGRDLEDISEDIDDEYIIEFTDYNFAMQIQEMQMFREEFLGRTIRYEGMFMYSFWEDETIYFVARADDGCCGIYGFEVYLNDIPRVEMETWVEVTGVLEEFYIEGVEQAFMRINLTSMIER